MGNTGCNLYILDETKDFAVVCKPPRMHCAPLRQGDGNTLLAWYAAIFPPVMALSGRKAGEGGLLHRLDFETQGLVLFAKNQESLENLREQQEQGNFIKEYSAIGKKTALQWSIETAPSINTAMPQAQPPIVIESFFRPFGPGRKQVRPLAAYDHNDKDIASDHGAFYRTEVFCIDKSMNSDDQYCFFTLRIKRGFRHQLRCHLAWIGWPLVNDPLYGTAACIHAINGGFLALRANKLLFNDPCSGKQREYTIASLEMPSEMA